MALDGLPRPPRIALVTAQAARDLDEDLPPLDAALRARGAEVAIVAWDDPVVVWDSFDLAVLRSTWDYTGRLPDFLAWTERVAAVTTLLNSLGTVRWNTDKHYLAELADAGVPVVPTYFLEPGVDARTELTEWLARDPSDEFVVKPAVGAGSRDAQRYVRAEYEIAITHAARLLDAGRSVVLQPYLGRVDTQGETALIVFAGKFSHAIRKGALLERGAEPSSSLFAPERITPRDPTDEELKVAAQALSAIPFGIPLYARVDLIRDAEDRPCLLELELTEPSLFFAHAPGSADHFADDLIRVSSRLALRTPVRGVVRPA